MLRQPTPKQLADELKRRESQYERGLLSEWEYEWCVLELTCIRNHIPTLKELGINDRRFEITAKLLDTCPNCGGTLFRINPWHYPTQEELDDPEILLCPKRASCCPRCHADATTYEVEEYEPACCKCGRAVGRGKHRRMVTFTLEPPHRWECELCFESGN